MTILKNFYFTNLHKFYVFCQAREIEKDDHQFQEETSGCLSVVSCEIEIEIELELELEDKNENENGRHFDSFRS